MTALTALAGARAWALAAAATVACAPRPTTGPGAPGTPTAENAAAVAPAPAPQPPATGPAAAATPAEPEGMEMPAAKRVGPPEVSPVTVGTLTFQVVPWGKARGLGQNGGYIAALGAGGKELWTLKVYEVKYDPKLEEDVQDVFIEAMTRGPSPNELSITDERGRRYRVDVQTRRVRNVQ